MEGGRDLTALPKAHLHIHLFCSVRRATVAEFARAAGWDEPAVARLLGDIEGVDGMTSFLTASRAIQDLIRTPEDVDRICREFVADEAAAGVVHTEPSFAPHDLAARFGMSADQLFARMDRVMRDEARRNGISVAYVIAPNRGRDDAYLKSVAEFAVRMRGHGVVAFGYGGDERWGHDRVRDAVTIARAGGLAIDPHAGETVGAHSVGEALSLFTPERIAHGVTALGDAAVTSELVRLRIPCDVSIASNARLGVVPSAADHPLRKMLDAGMVVTLNADDTTFFSTSVAEEFALARDLGCDDAALADIARNSIRAAFMHEPERRRALARVDRWLRTAAPPGRDGCGIS